MQAVTLYTIGHSNRPLDELMALLKEAGVKVLVDVRAEPRSRHNPQFNEESLRDACTRADITYHWAGRQLGGLRTGRPDSPHTALDEGRRSFADYMDTEPFRKGASQLLTMATRAPTAILCAEREPEHCHRSLISDYLLLQGVSIVHLIRPGETREHVLSPEARRESAALVYDRHTSGTLPLE
jgi:uncharacterized protein (DUF488 family)